MSCAEIFIQFFRRSVYARTQQTGYGGTISEGHDTDKVENMEPITDRVITIQFNADRAASMRWNFKPQQYEIKVCYTL